MKRMMLWTAGLMLLTLLSGCRYTHTVDEITNNLPGGNNPAELPTATADTLYAMPRVLSAGLNEAVSFLVYTGVPANPLAYVNGVGIVVPEDAEYVDGSFNVGAVGGANNAADGIWTAAPPASGFLMPPDEFIAASPTGAWNGYVRWDFNLTPISGENITDTAGELFNFEFTFSTIGKKNVRLEQFNGVSRTYYSDADQTQYYWGTLYNNSPANDVALDVQ